MNERARGRRDGRVLESTPLATRQTPDSTTQSRSVSDQCGALMYPGHQRIMTKYCPGWSTAPNMDADSAVLGGKL